VKLKGIFLLNITTSKVNKMSKRLVVYYSRTGNTKKVAERIANDLSCDIASIKPLTSYKGMLGWLKAGSQGVRRKIPEIESINENIKEYDLVILGSPMWGSNLSSPVRAFLTKSVNEIKKIAFFYTCNGNGSDKIFEELNNLTEIEPVATLGVLRKQVEDNEEIDKFIEKL